MADQKFIQGLYVDAPRDGAPDFVKGSITFKRKELGNWLREQTDDWINIDVKESKEGKWYAALNDFKPDSSKKKASSPPPADDYDDSDPPF